MKLYILSIIFTSISYCCDPFNHSPPVFLSVEEMNLKIGDNIADDNTTFIVLPLEAFHGKINQDGKYLVFDAENAIKFRKSFKVTSKYSKAFPADSKIMVILVIGGKAKLREDRTYLVYISKDKVFLLHAGQKFSLNKKCAELLIDS